MNRTKSRRAVAAATRVPFPVVRAITGADGPRLTAEGCDVRAEIDAIIGAWPTRTPMPTEPGSGLCGYRWTDGLPWGDTPGRPGFLCTLQPGHPGKVHRAVGRDGSTIAEHDEVAP